MKLTFTVETQRLTRTGMKELAATIQESFKSITPNQAYAVCKIASDAFKKAQDGFADTALEIAESEHQRQNCKGAEVQIDGLTFQVKHEDLFDFSKKREWKLAEKNRLVAKNELDKAKLQQSHVEEILRLNMKPIGQSTTLAFVPKNA